MDTEERKANAASGRSRRTSWVPDLQENICHKCLCFIGTTSCAANTTSAPWSLEDAELACSSDRRSRTAAEPSKTCSAKSRTCTWTYVALFTNHIIKKKKNRKYSQSIIWKIIDSYEENEEEEKKKLNRKYECAINLKTFRTKLYHYWDLFGSEKRKHGNLQSHTRSYRHSIRSMKKCCY